MHVITFIQSGGPGGGEGEFYRVYSYRTSHLSLWKALKPLAVRCQDELRHISPPRLRTHMRTQLGTELWTVALHSRVG